MPSSAQRDAGPAARPRWPRLGRPQILLAVAALVTIVASFLPWLETALVGPASGVALRTGDNAIADGMWTFYAAALALPGVIWRRPLVVAGHALLLAVVDITVPGWRLIWALRRLPGFGEAWLPGSGMLLVLISGVVAAIATVQILRLPAHGGTRSPSVERTGR